MELIDSHAHLAYRRFEGEEAEVVRRARDAGISHLVNPGITEASVARSLELADQFPGYVSVGVSIHPNDALQWQPETYNRFKALTADPRVVAIGETGLDYYRDHCPRETQHDVFRQHIRLARETGKPLIIHVRDAHADLMRILDEESAREIGGVMHCFSGDLDHALACIARNFYISFAGNLTYKNATALQHAAANLPLDRLMIETDSPFLAPMPYRGKPNEPAYVRYVAEMLAQLQDRPVEDVAKATAANARCLFHLPA